MGCVEHFLVVYLVRPKLIALHSHLGIVGNGNLINENKKYKFKEKKKRKKKNKKKK